MLTSLKSSHQDFDTVEQDGYNHIMYDVINNKLRGLLLIVTEMHTHISTYTTKYNNYTITVMLLLSELHNE